MPSTAASPRTPDPEAIAAAAAALRAGRLVGFPTETVYGLGADASNGRAVAAIFAAKGRPRFNPLIVHVTDMTAARTLAEMGPMALKLAAAFWPGPLTLVLRRRADAGISDLVTAGLETIAIRVPSHPVAQALLAAAACPVAAPSANVSGHVSATTAAHVAADLASHVAVILDGGASPHGIESTVLEACDDHLLLLRPGAVTLDAIAAVAGVVPDRAGDMSAAPHAPGQLASHYAPRARVRLDARNVRAGEALLAFGASLPAHDGPQENLSPAGDLAEAAANLFAALRRLDATGADTIAVMPIPEHGLGEAINDRLRRAAAPR